MIMLQMPVMVNPCLSEQLNFFQANVKVLQKIANYQAIIAIPLDRDNMSGLVSNLTSSAINKFDRKISEKGAVRGEK